MAMFNNVHKQNQTLHKYSDEDDRKYHWKMKRKAHRYVPAVLTLSKADMEHSSKLLPLHDAQHLDTDAKHPHRQSKCQEADSSRT